MWILMWKRGKNLVYLYVKLSILSIGGPRLIFMNSIKCPTMWLIKKLDVALSSHFVWRYSFSQLSIRNLGYLVHPILQLWLIIVIEIWELNANGCESSICTTDSTTTTYNIALESILPINASRSLTGCINLMAIPVVKLIWKRTKLERFLHKNQHTQRKLLNFEFWISSNCQKEVIILEI